MRGWRVGHDRISRLVDHCNPRSGIGTRRNVLAEPADCDGHTFSDFLERMIETDSVTTNQGRGPR